MGLGLSALAAILLLAPGLAFIVGLGRLASSAGPSTGIDQHVSIALLAATVASLFFHGAALTVASGWCWLFSLPDPDPSQVLALLAGKGDAPGFRAAEASFSAHPISIAWYFLATTVVAWRVGLRFSRSVRVRDPWYLLLRPDDPEVDFVVLTVNVQIDDCCHLFTGLLQDFSTSSDGKLERIVLSYAARRRYSGPESVAPRGHPLGNGWIEIPGEFLVINLDPLATINVDYFYIDPPGEPPATIYLPGPFADAVEEDG